MLADDVQDFINEAGLSTTEVHRNPSVALCYEHALKYEKTTEHTIGDAATFLARLEETRRHGYGMDDQEFRDEVRCIAAPIFDFRGLPVGALSISTLVFRVPKDTLISWAPMLIAAAKSISRKIGYVD